jgi:hypothetical protein
MTDGLARWLQFDPVEDLLEQASDDQVAPLRGARGTPLLVVGSKSHAD